jgi:prevent-host-death family protein
MYSMSRGRSIDYIMKIIPLTEAKAHLSRYAALCHEEPIIVTVNGTPAFQLVPIEEEDDLINSLIEHHPTFRHDLERRLKEAPVPWKPKAE